MVYPSGPKGKKQEPILQVGLVTKFTIFSALIAQTPLSRVNIPDIYKSTYADIFRADATAVHLGKLNKYFYELGRYVSAFDRNGFVGKMIYEVGFQIMFPIVNNLLIYFSLFTDMSCPDEISKGFMQQYQ